MSSKNKIAVLIFVVVASLSLWLYLRKSEGTIRKEFYDFQVSDTSSITKVYMVNAAGNQVMLEKQKGRWMVNNKFRARNDAIVHLLACIKDLRVSKTVGKNAIETISKQLATEGTKVEIYNGEKLLKRYYVGADTQDGLGTFMLLTDTETGENSTLPFVMSIPGFNGFLSVRYFIKEEEWRDTHVFNYYPDEISSISVHFNRYPDSSYTFSLNDKNEISLADSKGKNNSYFDTTKAKSYITYYTNNSYEDLKNDVRKTFKDSILSKGAVHIITLKEKNGNVHEVKTFSKPPLPDSKDSRTGQPLTEDMERMYALLDGKDFCSVQYYNFGKLFMSVSSFMKKENHVAVKK